MASVRCVRVVSAKGAEREGVEMGSFGEVVSSSWVMSNGYCVRDDDGVLHHFGPDEIKDARQRTSHDEEVLVKCRVCQKQEVFCASTAPDQEYTCSPCRRKNLFGTSAKECTYDRSKRSRMLESTSFFVDLLELDGAELTHERKKALSALPRCPEMQGCLSDREMLIFDTATCGLSVREIEKVTGVSKTQVQRDLESAVKKLRLRYTRILGDKESVSDELDSILKVVFGWEDEFVADTFAQKATSEELSAIPSKRPGSKFSGASVGDSWGGFYSK